MSYLEKETETDRQTDRQTDRRTEKIDDQTTLRYHFRQIDHQTRRLI